MIWLLKNYEKKKFENSNSGTNIKPIYKLDHKNYELMKVQEIDLQKQIDSFYNETNYKEIMSRIHRDDDIELEILRRYPENENIKYGDSTIFANTYLENWEMSRFLSQLDFTAVNQQTENLENEVITNEPKE